MVFISHSRSPYVDTKLSRQLFVRITLRQMKHDKRLMFTFLVGVQTVSDKSKAGRTIIILFIDGFVTNDNEKST